MLYRYTYLEKDRTLDNSGERVVDITVRDPITAIWVEVRATNGSSYNHYNPVHTNVTDVEVIDGARVLYSLDGQQALALACYNLGYMPHQRFSALGGDPQSMSVPIMFGRYIGDTQYAFDPTRFVNPQLRIKWNLGTTRAVGATSFADGGGTLTVILEVLEGAARPTGLLMAKEHYTWTSAVGTEYIDLPRDYPYKGVMYNSSLAAYHPYDVVSDLKLNCDGGKYTPLDVGVEDLIYLMSMRQNQFHYRISDHLKDGDTFYSYLEELEDVGMINENNIADIVAGYWNYEYGSQLVSIYIAGVAASSYYNIGAHVHGYCPFGYLYVPFGYKDEPADWFPAPQFGSVRLEAKGAVASGACHLAVVQAMPY